MNSTIYSSDADAPSRLDDGAGDGDARLLTPHLDWYLSLNQVGLAICWRPRNEYGIEFLIGPLVLTFRWRHGWRQQTSTGTSHMGRV